LYGVNCCLFFGCKSTTISPFRQEGTLAEVSYHQVTFAPKSLFVLGTLTLF